MVISTLRVSWLYYNILTCSGMEVDSTGNGRIEMAVETMSWVKFPLPFLLAPLPICPGLNYHPLFLPFSQPHGRERRFWSLITIQGYALEIVCAKLFWLALGKGCHWLQADISHWIVTATWILNASYRLWFECFLRKPCTSSSAKNDLQLLALKSDILSLLNLSF